jgi:hypothetical protein
MKRGVQKKNKNRHASVLSSRVTQSKCCSGGFFRVHIEKKIDQDDATELRDTGRRKDAYIAKLRGGLYLTAQPTFEKQHRRALPDMFCRIASLLYFAFRMHGSSNVMHNSVWLSHPKFNRPSVNMSESSATTSQSSSNPKFNVKLILILNTSVRSIQYNTNRLHGYNKRGVDGRFLG